MSEQAGDFGGKVEKPLFDGLIKFHVVRHDSHENGFLTPEGRENARRMADEAVREYLDTDPDTNFMIIASDQIPDEDKPEEGGMRAVETAEVVVDAIKQGLKDRNLPEKQLFASDGNPIMISQATREAGIFATGYAAKLKELHPASDPKNGKHFWQFYYQEGEIDAKLRERLAAESSKDLAMRMDYAIKTAEMVGASFYKVPGNEQKPLVVWMVGHGGGLDSYVSHYADVPVEKVGFPSSGGFKIYVNDQGVVVAEVKGKQYPIKQDDQMELAEHPVVKGIRQPKLGA